MNDSTRTVGKHGIHIRCPHCRNPVEVVAEREWEEVECPSCSSIFNLCLETTDVEPSNVEVAHFQLRNCLGQGTFGEVWKAYDPTLDRFVAVKIPRKGQVFTGGAGEFVREAQAAAQLNHPHIVKVYEIGRERDQLYIVSEFVDGVTLQSWLSKGHLGSREACTLLVKIARAIQHAHEQGVIHRDLKPGNIMLDAEKQPKVLDFGLAKRESAEITMTRSGTQLGTPAYMPPEQVASANTADARSDVYALGVILFEMLTGELPFRGDRAMLLHQVRFEEPPSPRQMRRDLPRDLETICLKCMAKAPTGRYQSAQELVDDLDNFLGGRPIVAKPVGPIEKVFRWYLRHAYQVAIGFWLVCPAVGILIFLSDWLWGDQPEIQSMGFLISNLGCGVTGLLALNFGKRWFALGLGFVPFYVWLGVLNVWYAFGPGMGMAFVMIAVVATTLATIAICAPGAPGRLTELNRPN